MRASLLRPAVVPRLEFLGESVLKILTCKALLTGSFLLRSSLATSTYVERSYDVAVELT